MTLSSAGARGVAFVGVLALVLLLAGTVAAHAQLVETTPADGDTVQGTPDEIAAVFDEPLEYESTLSLRDPQGQRLTVGRVDPDDPKRLVIDDVPELARGTYEMRWTAATADGHLERGTWTFSVVPAPPTKVLPTPEPTASAAPSAAETASPTPSPTATPSPSAAPSPSASPAPTDPASAAGGDVILPIIIGLAIVLIAGGALLSRRGRTSGGA